MRRPRLRRPSLRLGLLALPAVAALAALLLAGGGARGAAPSPSTIAKGLPAGAVAYLEVPDAAALIAAWRGSDAHAALVDSAADVAMRKSMLWLRLGERVAALETLAGVSLDWERAELLFGKEAGVAIYDLADTRFVLVARLRSSRLADSPLAAAAKKLAKRRHGGVDYFVHEPAGAGTAFAFALLGDRLIVGNDLPHFRAALLLTAAQAGIKTDTRAGASLADDLPYKDLLAASPAAADARVFVRLSALAGTHHFDDFWIFHWAAGTPSARLRGVDGSLLTLRLGPGGATETRVHDVTDAAALTGLPQADQLPGQGVGLVDGAAACAAALPPGLLVAVSDDDPAFAVQDLMPTRGAGGFWSDDDTMDYDNAIAGPAMDLRATLQAAGAGRLLDLSTLTAEARRDGAAHLRRGGAVAVRLGKPDALDRAVVEKALLATLRAAVGARVPLAFADGAGGVRVLPLPLVGAAEWRLTLRLPRAGEPWLIVATDEAAAAALAKALGTPALGALLTDGAPRCSRLDMAAAAAAWKVFAAATTQAPVASEAVREFAQEIAPALFATAHLTSLTNLTYAWRRRLVEQTEYRW